jgi:hypothetical protein
VEVGKWRILRNLVCGDDVVTFYAIGPDEQPVLAANLREFSGRLPKEVVESGKYLYQ